MRPNAYVAAGGASAPAHRYQCLRGGVSCPGIVSACARFSRTGLQPRYLEQELPEPRRTQGTRLIEDSQSVADLLKELREIGALLALDDFGMGYSSVKHCEGLAD